MMPKTTFPTLANGKPIRQYIFKQKPQGSISISLAQEEVLARQHVGMSIEEYNNLPGTRRWVDDDNPTLSKSDVIAIYRLHKLTEAVYQDMSQPKSKPGSKSMSKRRTRRRL